MRGPRTNDTLRIVAAGVLGALLLLALPHPVLAQPTAPSAELKRVIGRVEILRKGQTQWVPAVIGARLVEGDDIRAFSGAQAELALPDTSTVTLAENSRLLLTKLEVDRQSQSRLVLLHLVVGKVRAVIAQTAITLVRARQSNFAISTPTAVAAARGTILWMFHDGQTWMAVESEPRLRIQSRIECITLATTNRKRQMVLAGTTTMECATPVLTSPEFLTLSNPATAGANLGAPVVAPATANIVSLITSTGPEPGPGVSFNTTGAPISGVADPSSVGVNAALNQPPPPSPPVPATAGAD
jgi:hypothetical protein